MRMMNIRRYKVETVAKTLRFAALLPVAFAGYALAMPAQIQPPALPALPGLPAVPQPAAAPQAPLGALPDLPLPNTQADLAAAAATGKPVTIPAMPQPTAPLADLPLPAPESSDVLKPAPMSEVANVQPAAPAVETPPSVTPVIPPLPGLDATTTAANGAPELPALNLPTPPMDDVTNAMPLVPLPTKPTALPEVTVTKETERKTWETTLAPAITPKETKFNYKRQLLPGTIYSRQYADYNEHLPRLVTRQDYEAQLFLSARENDVETVRALLNAGTNINATNASGDTVLTVASNAGARGAARLLIARGAR